MKAVKQGTSKGMIISTPINPIQTPREWDVKRSMTIKIPSTLLERLLSNNYSRYEEKKGSERQQESNIKSNINTKNSSVGGGRGRERQHEHS